MKNLIRLCFLALVAILMVACGGGSTLVTPHVSIDWPSLTRNVTAPSYASSVVFTLTPTASSKSITWTANRPAGTGAQTVTSTGPQVADGTAGTLDIAFKADADGNGNTVATASAAVKVGSNGVILNSSGGDLGTVGYTSDLTGITVDAPDVNVGSTVTVTATGTSASGIVALPQDLVDFSITSGNSFATIDKNQVTGVAPGSVTVQASFESLTASDGLTVAIPTIGYTRYDFGANQIAADVTNNKIWGTFSASSAHPNSIVDIDVSTGTIGTPIPVGTNPDAIGISPDGTVAYVGLDDDQTIQVVDLTNRTAGATLSYTQLDANTIPIDIKVNPLNNNEIAIGVKSMQNGAQRGPYVVRNGGTAIAATVETGGFQSLDWISGTEIVRNQTGTLATYTVTSTTVDQTQRVVLSPQVSGNLHLSTSSRLITDDGQVFSSTDFSKLGDLMSPDSFLRVAADNSHDMAWAAVGSTTNPLKLRSFELTGYTSSSLYILPMNNEPFLQLIRFGPTGLAVRSQNSVYVMPTAPGL
ncbi:MAG: hypothetical protein JST12_05570 [Armatimonadetes bacterium]|nr:hypothetical protein [Armatimonadota bacterium]